MDYVCAESADEEAGDAGADAGGIDGYGLAVPDVFEKIDQLGEELAVFAAGPPVEADQVEVGLLETQSVLPDDPRDGDRGGIALGLEGAEDGVLGLFVFAGQI